MLNVASSGEHGFVEFLSGFQEPPAPGQLFGEGPGIPVLVDLPLPGMPGEHPALWMGQLGSTMVPEAFAGGREQPSSSLPTASSSGQEISAGAASSSQEALHPVAQAGTSAGGANPGRRRSKLSAEERLARQRECNRLAQMRYRARRRAGAEQQTQRLDETTAELATARADAAVLASQHRMLEQLLSIRDASLTILQRARGGEDAAAAALEPGAVPGHGHGHGHGHGGCSHTGTTLTCNYAEPGMTPSQLAVLHCMCSQHDAGQGNDAWLPPEQAMAFSALSPEVVAERWAGHVTSMRIVLEELDRCPEAHIALENHLKQIMVDGRYLKWRVAHYMQGRMAEVRYVVREATLDDWKAVVLQLQLSPEQGQRLLRLARATRWKLGKTVDRRKAILANITAVRASEAAAPLLNHCTESLSLLELVSALEKNMEEERDVYALSAFGAFSNVFTLVQKARIVVLAYMFGTPDVASMLAAWEEASGLVEPYSPVPEEEGLRDWLELSMTPREFHERDVYQERDAIQSAQRRSNLAMLAR